MTLTFVATFTRHGASDSMVPIGRPRVTVAQSRVVRVAACVGAVLLVLTFVVRGYYHRFLHPDLLHVLMYPVPAVVVVALLAGALVASGLVYACVEGKGRLRRIVAAGALALLPLALLVSAWLWWWD